MPRINLQQVDSLRTLYPFPLPADASNDACLSALQELCPRVTVRPFEGGVAVVGSTGKRRGFTYPFRNDAFYIAAAEL